MCSPLEQVGRERERIKEGEKGEPYTRIPDTPPTTATLSPTSSPSPMSTGWSLTSPPLLPLSNPLVCGFGTRSRSDRPSPYGQQTATPQDLVQHYRMQVKDLLPHQLEKSQDLTMILGIWEKVLTEKKDHDVLGCRNCKFLLGLRAWKYCPQSHYHKKHPAHLCLLLGLSRICHERKFWSPRYHQLVKAFET